MLVRKRLPLGKKLIATVDSSVNGKISVYQFWGRPILEVSGLEQSGDFIASIWKKALRRIFNFQTPIFNVLILGLGAGSAAGLINRFWPQARITGIEIDPEIIKLGRQYFRLNEVSNLEIILADAVDWLPSSDKSHKNYNYNLILVDLYLGDQMPLKCQTKEFLTEIKQWLTPGGIAIFNRLYYQQKKEETDRFAKRLGAVFSHLDRIRTPSNLFILAS